MAKTKQESDTVADLVIDVGSLISLYEETRAMQLRNAEMITELDVRSRFALSMMQLAKKNEDQLVIGPNDRPVIEYFNGWTAYNEKGGRERMLAVLNDEYQSTLLTHQAMELQTNGDTRDLKDIVTDLHQQSRSRSRGNGSGEEGRRSPFIDDPDATTRRPS